MDSPDGKPHGQPTELIEALLCDVYPWLAERAAMTEDGYVDVNRLLMLREVLAIYQIARSAIRKPSRVKGADGQWRDGWTQSEKDLMYELMQLRREAEHAGQ